MSAASPPPLGEIQRQYRVAKQTLGIHAALRDRYRRLSQTAEVTLVLVSILLAVLSVAPEGVVQTFGISQIATEYALSLASLVAVIASTTLLLVDWRDKAADHDNAVSNWTEVVSSFRKNREHTGGSWSTDVRSELAEAYWQADAESASIPDDKFLPYKAKYLRKVEISRLQSQHPGAPYSMVAAFVVLRDGIRVLTKVVRNAPGDEDNNESS